VAHHADVRDPGSRSAIGKTRSIGELSRATKRQIAEIVPRPLGLPRVDVPPPHRIKQAPRKRPRQGHTSKVDKCGAVNPSPMVDRL
jgi:hypothetical protein